MTSYGTLIARILFSFIFIMAGLSKIGRFAGTQQYMEAMWPYWLGMTPVFALAAIVIEVFGGFSIALGYKARVGAWVLIIFMIPTTLIFHTNFADQMQFIQFMKNMAMTGGLIYVAAYGPGDLSLDRRMKKSQSER
ncbi:MAG: DoxX family protein [Nitrospiria bacterium]